MIYVIVAAACFILGFLAACGMGWVIEKIEDWPNRHG